MGTSSCCQWRAAGKMVMFNLFTYFAHFPGLRIFQRQSREGVVNGHSVGVGPQALHSSERRWLYGDFNRKNFRSALVGTATKISALLVTAVCSTANHAFVSDRFVLACN